MTKVTMVLLLAASALFGGCDKLLVVPVRAYCDREVSYTLWKQEGRAYRLHLNVGAVDERVCIGNLDVSREINLSQDVSSPEEADKLVEKYRRLYVEKLAARRPTMKLELPKLPAKRPATPQSQNQCPKPDPK